MIYQDLKNTDWRNEEAIAEYRRTASFTVPQHKIPKTEKQQKRWQANEKAQQRAQDVELGREQPGLEDNKKNKPALMSCL